MSKSISTLVLLGISVLIVLYILSSFHEVFNRQSIHEQVSTVTTEGELSEDSTATAQGIINLNKQITDSAALITEKNTDNNVSENITAAVSSGSEVELTSATNNVQELVNDSSDSTEEEPAVDIVGTPGDMLRDKPHLQNALPPIPQAPPRPQGSPIVTAPTEESFSQTGNSHNPFPAPITNTDSGTINRGSSAFPTPTIPNANRSSSSIQGSNSFPAPR